jgi:biopolymer transport protein TolR
MLAPTSVGRSSDVYRVQAEINVTPLVDVMLVLLIIFMVTAPMLASGLHVKLPQAKAAEKLDQKPPVVLTFSKDGHVTLDGQDYNLDQIVDAVQTRLGDDRTQSIHLRADKDASYGDVVGLMDVLSSHGLTRLAILTGPASKTAPAASASAAAPADKKTAPVAPAPVASPASEGTRP